jgi:putative mRNA 3-end processing factor
LTPLRRRDIDWIAPHPTGIEIKGANAWIDPSEPREIAIVTHGHADHARGGHGLVYATPQTLAIMTARYGPSPARPLPHGEEALLGDVRLSLHPAGHVLGSAQARLERAGETVVVTGDFKRAPDPTCLPFEPVACDVLVTEATFGLPVFRHPPPRGEIDKALARLAESPGRCLLIGAYALGKAQRVIAELRRAGHDAPIFLHGALERMCALYVAEGVDLGELRPATGARREEMIGHVALAPPSALKDRWTRRLPDPILAMASGWLQVRQRVRQRNIDLPLVISDHADWRELTETILEVAPAEVWITHGGEAALAHWCMSRQIAARALSLVGRDGGEEGGDDG